ncbi:response regulator [Piscinibacter sakaiensis]|uniref:response regulator n=1 Tax=Piscinibacter sakaiensis TaxID=1547922 RepID=UPI003AB08C3A
MASKLCQMLVVIDEKSTIRQSVLETLDDGSSTVLTAASAAAALELLEQHDPALALVDLELPGLDGIDLARRIHQTDKGRHIPIILLISSKPGSWRDFSADAGGVIDFLYSPPDPGLLRAKVNGLIELQRQRREMADRIDDMKRLSKVNALMIGALSHDIRTPLAALALNAELVIRRAEPQGLRQAGERIKAATATLGRQVDHLVNLSSLPGDDLRPVLAEADLAELARSRIDIATGFMLADVDVKLQVDGDVRGMFDSAMIGEALDQLLLLCAIHGAGVPVRVHADGHSRRSLVLRVEMDTVLPDASCQHLFGGGQAVPGLPPSQVGPGLHATERVARAHGGSFVGRSRDREGTLFELILPRSEG